MKQQPDWVFLRPGWPLAVWCSRSRPAEAHYPPGSGPLPGGTNTLATGVFSHFTPDTVALLTSVQKAALEEWAVLEPAAAPMLKAVMEVAVARKLLDVASTGERDPERLMKAALSDVTFSTAVENACGNDRPVLSV